jgi:hypothetical protein
MKGTIENKKVYISGPIAGYDLHERWHTFEITQNTLEYAGATTFNPMKNGLSVDAPRNEHLKKDIAELVTCDFIYLLNGWEKSEGCRVELDVALACGIKVLIEDLMDHLAIAPA